jgi:peroxisomal enoyl-CoA hydratase 2
MSESVLADTHGTPYAKLYVGLLPCFIRYPFPLYPDTKPQSSTFNLGAKATGEKFSKFIAGPPQAKPVPKDRKPDWVFKDKTTPEQAIVFRLSGDYNPLHIGQLPRLISAWDTLKPVRHLIQTRE